MRVLISSPSSETSQEATSPSFHFGAVHREMGHPPAPPQNEAMEAMEAMENSAARDMFSLQAHRAAAEMQLPRYRVPPIANTPGGGISRPMSSFKSP